MIIKVELGFVVPSLFVPDHTNSCSGGIQMGYIYKWKHGNFCMNMKASDRCDIDQTASILILSISRLKDILQFHFIIFNVSYKLE